MTRPRRVLVVDDSGPVRELLAKALRQHGFVVHEADGGAAALRMAIDLLPELAIVDQWMPGMTGAELIRLLREVPHPGMRAMRIIGLSGRPGSERELLGAGADAFLRKPFGDLELRAALEAVVGDEPDAGAVPA
jgi:two-component system KDP operon response regulator KdpE